MLGYSAHRRSLFVSLAASLALHATLLAVADARMRGTARPKDNVSARLEARLTPPPAAPVPRLSLPEPKPAPADGPAARPHRQATPSRPAAKLTAAPAPRARSVAPAAPGAADPLVRQALAQLSRELLYPLEAIERGLEGEVLLTIFLDAGGTVVAARVERGSGHAILDQAAVTAARRLRGLPAAATEFELPVRFRLD